MLQSNIQIRIHALETNAATPRRVRPSLCRYILSGVAAVFQFPSLFSAVAYPTPTLQFDCRRRNHQFPALDSSKNRSNLEQQTSRRESRATKYVQGKIEMGASFKELVTKSKSQRSPRSLDSLNHLNYPESGSTGGESSDVECKWKILRSNIVIIQIRIDVLETKVSNATESTSFPW